MYEKEAAYAGNLGAVGGSRQSEVSAQLGELNGALDRLLNIADSLCSKLVSVQRPESPVSAVTGGNVPVPVLCPLADQIRSAKDMVERCIQMLGNSRDRIEL